MAKYIRVPFDTDPEDLLADAILYLQGKIPGWQPADGNLDYWILQATSSLAAELMDVVSAVPEDIFRYFGAELMSLPPVEATPASTTSTWTMRDNAGYTIPDGTRVSIRNAAGESIPFHTVGSVSVPAGSINTVVGAVLLLASTPGADGSGLGGAGASVSLEDTMDFVTAITMVAATSGGLDAEDDDVYLDRLRSELQTLAPRPILPQDFAVFARNITGVYRALGVDGYDPGLVTYGNARTVSVALMDSAGNAVSAPVKAAVDADLQARREVNFLVYEIDPTRTEIDITYNVHLLPGYDSAATIAEINTELTAYLNPLLWGVPVDGDPRDWINTPTVRYLEVAQTINNVMGVDYITVTGGNTDLTIGIHGGALARVDIALPGAAPVPHADVLTGTSS